MTGRDTRRAFVSRPSDSGAWVRSPELSMPRGGVTADRFTARQTIDVTPELGALIKVVVFPRGVTVAEMLRDHLTRKCPEDAGGIA
jgi:hypothetical protein